MPRIIKDLTGQRFGRLVVIEKQGTSKDGHALWKCKCDCGTELPRPIIGYVLYRGSSKSCGCLNRELSSKRKTTHGLSHTPEHNIWSLMKDRCTNPKSISYQNYGGRGVSIAPEWAHDFTKFLNGVGSRPSPQHSLDRIDVNGNYEPGNVRWATVEEQMTNRRQYQTLDKFTDDEILSEVRRRGLT